MSRAITLRPQAKTRLYIDTDVILNYAITRIKRDYSLKSKKLLSKIENGDFEGVISLLALMECAKVLRSMAAEVSRCDPEEWKKQMAALVESLLQIRNIRFVEGNPTDRLYSPMIKDLLYGSISWQAYGIMEKYQGRCVTDPRDREKIVHDGLSSCDCFHICLAKAMGCNNIATFDRDFHESRAEIEPFFVQDRIGA